MKVYFAGSIRGGRIDANLYERLIKYIQKTDVVLTEHVGNLNLSEEGQTVTDIYNQDTNWLRGSAPFTSLHADERSYISSF